MNESIDPIILIAAKTLLYCGYIYLGLRRFWVDAAGYIVYSLALGVTRAILGLLFGGGAFVLATLIAGEIGFSPPTGVIGKFLLTSACLLPGRLLLWTILGRLVGGRLDRGVFLWIIGGVVISLPFDLYLCLHDKFLGPFIFVG